MTTLKTGLQIKEYCVEECLGQGGFGITYRATDTSDPAKTTVAIKEYFPREFASRGVDDKFVVPRPDKKKDFRNGLERFLREGKTVQSFHHPAIVRVKKLFQFHGTAYIVMEYAEGKTLSRWLNDKPYIDDSVLISMFGPILEGLREIHHKGYLHRDIKPNNIYIRDDGSAMLLDFGSARSTDFDISQTLTAVVSDGYTPPEQYNKKGKQGPWTDIYALGCTLYFCISSGAPPVSSITRLTAFSQKTRDPLIPSEMANQTGCSKRFLFTIDRMLKVVMAQRPQTVDEILAQWRKVDSTSRTLVPKTARLITQPKTPIRVGWSTLLLSATVILALGFSVMRMQEFISFERPAQVSVITGSDATLPKRDEPKPRQPAPGVAEVPAPQTTPGIEPVIADLPEPGAQTPVPPTQPELQPLPPVITPDIQPVVTTDTSLDQPIKPLPQPDAQENSEQIATIAPAAIPISHAGDPTMPEFIQALVLDAKSGDRDAQYKMAQINLKGKLVPKSTEKGMQWLTKAAKQNQVDAQVDLAFHYENGISVRKNEKKAFYWYAKASSANNAVAQAKLAAMYLDGRGINQDADKAVKLYQTAARNGDTIAQYEFAKMLYEGKGVTQDKPEAHYWFRHAALQGHRKAQYELAKMLENGEGTAKKPTLALQWYSKAAKKGDADAQNSLGRMNEYGLGTEVNIEQAIQWYDKAAKQKHAAAQYHLGQLYEQGKGVEKNLQTALRYYEKAAALDFDEAKQRLRQISKN